jgi:hypothetical protein
VVDVRRLSVVLAVSAGLLLASCSGGNDTTGTPGSTEAPSEQTSVSTPAEPDPTTTPERTVDALAACEAFIGDGGASSLMQRVPAALNSIGPELDAATAQELVDIADEIAEAIAVAPADIAVHLRSVQLPFQQAADALAGGGGAITLDTGAARDAVTPLLSACVDAGFHIDGPA